MGETARSRWLLAATALAAGVLGELFSPDLVLYGAGVDGLIVLQILFFGLILLGLYISTGEIIRRRSVIQSPSVLMPENANTETPSASCEELQKHRDQSLWDRIWFLTTLVGGVLVILLMPASDLITSSYDHVTVFTLTSGSFVVGWYCVVSTPYLRLGTVSHNRGMVSFSSVVLVLTTVLWVFGQWVAYVILAGDIALWDYIALARLSSGALLASAFLSLLESGLVFYFSRQRGHNCVEHKQRQA